MRLGIAALIVVLALPACGGSDDGASEGSSDQSASDFLVEHVERSLKGQFARVWENLHPAHQEVVSKSRFDTCQSERFEESFGSLPTDTEVEAIEEYDESLDVSGIGMVDTKAVTWRVSSESVDEASTDTSHAVMVEGSWKWILADSDYQAYKDGDCPD